MISITSKQAYEIACLDYSNNESEILAQIQDLNSEFGPDAVTRVWEHPEYKEYRLEAKQNTYYDYGCQHYLCVFSYKGELYGFETDSYEVENDLENSLSVIHCLPVEISYKPFYRLIKE